MTATIANFANGQLAAGSASIMMAPMKAAGQLTTVLFTNATAGVNAITIYVVRSGGAPGAANIAINAQTLAPGQAYVAPELRGRNLAIGDALYGFATNGSQVNFIIDGYTVS